MRPATALALVTLLTPVATVGAQERTPPVAYAPVIEQVQGIVRDVVDGGRGLLIELRRDDEMLRDMPSVTADVEEARVDPSTGSMLAFGVGADRLRRLDLSAAHGWVFIEDVSGGAPERHRLSDALRLFRRGQVVEIGAVEEMASRASSTGATARIAQGRPDPLNPPAGLGAYGGQVPVIRIEGWVHVRVNRAFE